MLASIKSKLADYKETSDTYIFGEVASGVEAKNINFGRTVLNEDSGQWELPNTEKSIKEVIKNIDEFYEARMLIMRGELYYCYMASEGETANDDIPKCAADLGIKVIQYGNFMYYGEESAYSKLVSYQRDEQGNIISSSDYYMCTPDLSGFNEDETYYVSFSDLSNVNTLQILNKISGAYTYKSAWYDYPNKNWANVLTLGDGCMTYWVWVPRYAYKSDQLDSESANYINIADSETHKNPNLDIVFVDTENKYMKNGEKTSLEDGWVVPESFTFGEKELGGFWMSKYEVHE